MLALFAERHRQERPHRQPGHPLRLVLLCPPRQLALIQLVRGRSDRRRRPLPSWVDLLVVVASDHAVEVVKVLDAVYNPPLYELDALLGLDPDALRKMM